MYHKVTAIKLDEIKLDKENPRFYEDLINLDKTHNQDEILKLIKKKGYSDIEKSIYRDGIVDPIWVVKTHDKTYKVIEGNRRIAILKDIKKNNRKVGFDYNELDVNLLYDATPKDIDKLRFTLQTTKKDWGPFNEAYQIYRLVEKDKFTIKETSDIVNKTVTFVEKELDNYLFYLEYKEFRKNKNLSENTKKYTYFQRSGQAVRDKFFGTKRMRHKFFELITETSEAPARIPHVAMKGGLYEFNKFANDPIILQKFLDNPNLSIESAYEEYAGKNPEEKIKWLKQIPRISRGFNRLDKIGISDIRKNKQTMEQIQNIYEKCRAILNY